MKAVILAAGYATRLYPLTENQPKCLLKVGGRTILDQILEKLKPIQDLDEVIVVTNAKFFNVLEQWKSQTSFDRPIRILNDRTTSNDNRLGAVGDLGLVVRECHLDADFLLLASDNLFEQPLQDFIDFAKSKKDCPAIAVYDIGDPKNAAKKFGVVESDSSGRVLSFEEKPEQPRSSRIGMGVYYYPKNTIPWVAEYLAQKNAQDAPGYYVKWILDRSPLHSFLFRGMWYDIGDLKALEEANKIFYSKSK